MRTRVRPPWSVVAPTVPGTRVAASPSGGGSSASATSQGWIATPTRPLRAPRRATIVAPPSSRTRAAAGERLRVAGQQVAAGEAGDEARRRGGRAARPGVPSWRRRPSSTTPTRVGERRRVGEVVRDEQRRDGELGEQVGELLAHLARVCASSAESGSSSSSTAGSRASARATATRWRSPPESRPGFSPARCAMPSRASSSSTRARPPKATFAAHAHVREQRVLLEHEADRAPVGRPVDPPRAVEPDVVAERDPAARGPVQAGDAAQHGRLARARGPDERDRLARRRSARRRR